MKWRCLCLLALRDEDARAISPRAGLARSAGANSRMRQCSARILDADLRPDDTASLNAFMAGLPPEEEALVSSWLLQKMPPNGLTVAQGWWNGLRQASLRRELQTAEGRMKLPQLDTGRSRAICRNKFLTCRSNSATLSALFACPRARYLIAAEGAEASKRAVGITSPILSKHASLGRNEKTAARTKLEKAAES